LLEGSFPRSLEDQLFERLVGNIHRVLRQATDQRHISHVVMIRFGVRAGDFEEAISNSIVSATRLFNHGERALLFCISRDECDRIARRLGWRPYHSSISGEARLQAMKLWKEGAMVGVVCTSKLHCCLDYPYVRYVLHLGFPRNIVDYSQAVGRAARAGGIGTSIILAGNSGTVLL
jgi:superfamily II DNA helicase RecQ